MRCSSRSVNRLGHRMKQTVRIQTRGRLTIPAEVRKALQVGDGDELVFVETAPGRYEIKAEARGAALLKRRRTARLDVPVKRQLDLL
jgi:AbrB family looped-hinge helix DNA binding protein